MVSGIYSALPSFAVALDAAALERVRQATVSVLPQVPRAQRNNDEPEGTGFAVGDGLTIVTADHVLGRANSVLLRLPDGEVTDGEIMVRDGETDLATIRVRKALQPLEMAYEVQAGEKVCSYGNAFGLGPSLSCGVVSATARSGVGFNRVEDFIQTDAAINPGMSGAPLVSEDGKVVGAVSAIFTKERDGDLGVNFAVSSRLVRVFLDDAEDGRIDRRRQGLLLRSEPPPGQTGKAGGRIMRIEPNSREEASELEAGDLVVAINGRPIFSQADYMAELALSGDEKMSVEIDRGGKKLTIMVPGR